MVTPHLDAKVAVDLGRAIGPFIAGKFLNDHIANVQISSLPVQNDTPAARAVAQGHAEPPLEPADLSSVDLEELDDYDDGATVGDVPRLRLVDPPRLVGVIVEATATGFETSKLTHNGTCWARVHWTRDELVELIGRAQAALET